MSDKRDPATSSEIASGRDATLPSSLVPRPEESLAFFQQQAAQAKRGTTADSGRDLVPELPPIAIRGDGHASGEGEDTRLTSRQLAQLMQPRDPNSPFRGFEDLSAIAAGGDTVPQGRRAAGQYANNEDVWQREVDRRIQNGDIDQNTLVVAITGHGPTIGYEMAKHFHSDIYQHYPAGALEPGFAEMKRDQAQTFAKATSDLLKQPRIGSSTVLDVDIHQDAAPLSKETVDSLPTADQLMRMGIKKIFVAEEKPPNADGAKPYETQNPDDPLSELATWNHKRIYDWLNALKKDGRIEIVTDGLDARDKNRTAHQQPKQDGAGGSLIPKP
ncbi:MAG: hypothetical protein JSS86_12070 [Cyanobacteria bacterium SZAS LIN-2]|nr:hypothetical protein [Cyanobacteria bacterium SZAS LIN-2]